LDDLWQLWIGLELLKSARHVVYGLGGDLVEIRYFCKLATFELTAIIASVRIA